MSRIKWLEELKWGEEQVEELRYVGFAYIRQGKYDIALPIFNALCILDPESWYDAQTLGAIHLQMGNANKAMKQFDKALKLDGDHSSTLINLAKAFIMLGKYEEGVKIADILKKETNPAVSNTAKAILLAYGKA